MLEKILYYISIPFLLLIMFGFSFVDKVFASETQEYYYSNENPAGGVCVYDSDGNYMCRGGSSYSYYSTAFNGYSADNMRFLAYSSSKPYIYMYYASLVEFMETNFTLPWAHETDTFTFTFFAKEDLSVSADNYAFTTTNMSYFAENYGSVFKDLIKLDDEIYENDDIYIQFSELSCSLKATNVYACSYDVDLNLNEISLSTLATGLFDSRGYEYTSVAFSRKINAVEKEIIVTPTPTPGVMSETNEKLDNIENSITDSTVDDSTANDFFNQFTTSDNGGISSIVTAPLRLINSLLADTNICPVLTLPIMGKNVDVPGGCLIWDKAPDSVVIIYRTIICGFFSFILLTNLFHEIEKIKNPNESGVSTLDL
ncbi:MAG: hypothetical protein E7168_01465 [Firmicutes bacterium]|nr:hypothetical protein [Bacillota bacterium]